MELIHALWEPGGAGPHPTIVALHGWGANALDLLGLAPYVAEGRFMLICPQGAMEIPVGPIRGYGWFPIAMGSPPRAEEVDAAVVKCERFIDQAIERYPV